MNYLRRLFQLWRMYAWLDFMWVTRSTQTAILFYASELTIHFAALASTLFLAESFNGIGAWNKGQILFMLSYAALVSGILEIGFGYNVLFIGRRLGRGQFDHTLIQPQPVWLALLTDGFNPFGASGAFLTGLVLCVWANTQSPLPWSLGWVATLTLNLLASVAIVLSLAFFWGSFAFFAPRAAEEINTPLLRMVDQLKHYPLDGLNAVLSSALLTALPIGFVAWYPARALLGLDPNSYAVWLTPLAALIAAGCATFIFRLGMKHYERTGSNRYRPMGHRG